MENLKPIIFLFPIIALILVSLLYAFYLKKATNKKATFKLPNDIKKGETIHVIWEVTDYGTPQMTRYQRAIVTGE